MDIAEFYFAFHRPAKFSEVRKGASLYSIFGHVEAFGYTLDNTWFFFDPGRAYSKMLITHVYDEVNELIASKFMPSTEVLRYSGPMRDFRVPIHPPMNCVTQCAGLIGLRAFTPGGFRKKLLANQAEIIHEIERT